MSHIGTLNEKPLHAALKAWVARPDARFEVPVDGFVIDVVQDDQLVEIQTGSLASMKRKLLTLVPNHRLRLIYPLPFEKWIIKLDPQGDQPLSRRKSPRRGRIEELFWEMVSFPQLLAHQNFTFELLLTREEEVRRFTGQTNWRRRGWVIEERRLLEVVDHHIFTRPADWRQFVPANMNTFTTRDLAAAAKVPIKLAQKMAYCLCKAGVVTLSGKRGRANLYQVDGYEDENIR